VSAQSQPTAPSTEVQVLPGAGRQVSPTQEYVAGQDRIYGVYAKWLRTLTWAIDDITQDFGDDVYERMALDPVVAATLTILVASVLEEGVQLSPAVRDKDHPDFELAQEIAAHQKEMLDGLLTPLDVVAWDMLSAAWLGNRVGELVWKYVDVGDRIYLDLSAIKVRPRHSTAFVVDVYGNVLGLSATSPRKNTVARPGQQALVGDNTMIRRDKFWVYSWRPREGNPLGTSVLRPAFSSWVDKVETLAERHKHLQRFASPSLFGTVGENATPVPILDAAGNELDPPKSLPPVQALYEGLVRWANGVAMAAPFGSQLQVVEAKGGGEVFDKSAEYDNKQIVKTILTQTLATEDAPHQARAAAQVHQGSIDTIVRAAKRTFAGSFRDDVLEVHVRRNWGDQAVHLTPTVTLGTTEAPDLARMMTAVSNLWKVGYPSKSQVGALDQLLNLPPRLGDELEELEIGPAALQTEKLNVNQTDETGPDPRKAGTRLPGTEDTSASTD
jgi:hypothetical protein